MIDATDIVPADIVILEAGDMVTAELRLTEAANLEIDEAILPGESPPWLSASDPAARMSWGARAP
ncbi:hypothetical protein [Ruegeria marina]|uniref:E1-E2 ATPase n=1 Tax=Ruegeria marina TaxID=639004 RepID=A0A1G6I6Y7_9RHOB|nr:hypothetical protein [Ruegeria marina]SDC02210.1 E1-E2 ATPase [Ruegeria marina]